MRVKTDQLTPGLVVGTRKVFDNFVAPAAPGQKGAARIVEDVVHQPRDRKSEPDRIVFFTDGTKCHCQADAWWTPKEGLR